MKLLFHDERFCPYLIVVCKAFFAVFTVSLSYMFASKLPNFDFRKQEQEHR